ncbi:hypothetical protein [Actinophytocola oryzae]|uniref:Uncharacterized protein n=1 Tax=Actinophytocola oryzae TaxID=502181 RepID=A0A4V3FTM1_9PSEU|nr:hypothetical protein [Actinophytocola oryzae]TDV51891.1 hypothetical protein CLV71_10520 [Actinophytocola oryzae]
MTDISIFPGAIITYHDPTRPETAAFLRAMATAGAELVDPVSGTRWAPVIRMDGTRSMVDVDWVVDVAPTAQAQHGHAGGRWHR